MQCNENIEYFLCSFSATFGESRTCHQNQYRSVFFNDEKELGKNEQYLIDNVLNTTRLRRLLHDDVDKDKNNYFLAEKIDTEGVK